MTMKKTEEKCLCGASEHIVLSCSGASDVGQISDLVARKLSKEGVRKMNCLAVVGAGIDKSIRDFKTKNILVIDGCPVDCGKRILEKNGISNANYLRLNDLGFKKGKTEVNQEYVNKVYEAASVFY
jgi:uncharacterized metal-binding protein